jgi:hypothetical protein
MFQSVHSILYAERIEAGTEVLKLGTFLAIQILCKTAQTQKYKFQAVGWKKLVTLWT